MPHPHRAARRVVALISLFAIGAAACSDDENDAVTTTTPTTVEGTATTVGATTTVPLPMGDIVATALTNHVFTQLAGMVVDAGLVDALRPDAGEFTVFAPTDAAFAKVPVDVLHAIQDADADGDGVPGDLATTVLLHHVVPGVITPDQLAAGELTSAAGTTLTITEVDGEFYVEGNKIGAGVEATNGYVYVMSDVLVPAIGDIPTVASTLPGFETLVSLVTDAGLVETLQGEGPFTVFAPVDAAFEALPAATVNAVTSDTELLTTVLTYHVLAGKYTIDQLVDGEYDTVAGPPITISHDAEGNTLVNGTPILVQNVMTTNGVVHVIGEVLIPPS